MTSQHYINITIWFWRYNFTWKEATLHFILKNKNQYVNYTRQQKYTNNNNRQREKQKGGIDSIETTFDFFPFFVMEFYLISHKCYY